ncbi:MAG: glycosyltransferase [Candidatus Aminicenantales bacterium]
MITYNHENYIRSAIEGVLMQKTAFKIELVIGEDCSTDDTRNICKEHEQKNPAVVKLLQSKVNLGMMLNTLRTLDACRGKYIAICEGDDYWTDSSKLQMQVDLLEANPDYGLVFTDASHYYEQNDTLIPAYDKTFRRKIPTGDVLPILLQGNNPYRTCTSMFRRSLIREYAGILTKHRFKMGDWVLWLFIAGQAKIGYLDHPTAVYRIREKSASHFDDLKKFVLFLKSSYQASIYFSDYYRQLVNRRKLKKNYRNSVLKYCVNQKQFKKLIEYSGCLPIALVAIAKEKLRNLIIAARKHK